MAGGAGYENWRLCGGLMFHELRAEASRRAGWPRPELLWGTSFLKKGFQKIFIKCNFQLTRGTVWRRDCASVLEE
jgi:hypothetical protein